MGFNERHQNFYCQFRSNPPRNRFNPPLENQVGIVVDGQYQSKAYTGNQSEKLGIADDDAEVLLELGRSAFS